MKKKNLKTLLALCVGLSSWIIGTFFVINTLIENKSITSNMGLGIFIGLFFYVLFILIKYAL